MPVLDWFFKPAEQPAWNNRGPRCVDYLTQAFKGVGVHEGIDEGLSVGTPLYASGFGTVVDVQLGWGGGWGNHCVIDYGDDIQVRLAHQSQVSVQIGDHVIRGQVIGYSGNSGQSLGPHVHAEVRQGFRRFGARGVPLDPLLWFGAVPVEVVPVLVVPPLEVSDMLAVFEIKQGDQPGAQHYLTDDGWRWLAGADDVRRKHLAGVIDMHKVKHVGVGEGKPEGHELDPAAFDEIDDCWNAYPVLDGPYARPVAA